MSSAEQPVRPGGSAEPPLSDWPGGPAEPALSGEPGLPAEPSLSGAIARAAVARVLGIEVAALRADTPLAPLGWDSLACVCWTDAVIEAGWRSDSTSAARASSVGDLAACVLAPDGAR